MQGLGDAVKVVTDALGIEQCSECEKRQSKLNKLFPFKKAQKPTDEDMKFLTEVFSWYEGLPIPRSKTYDIIMCEAIWMRLFNVKTDSCRSCGATYQNNYMKDLKRLWENTNT
jgi:hypothetical protein